MKLLITNQELFARTVDSVDTSGVHSTDYYNGIPGNFCATGCLIILEKHEDGLFQKEIEGEHGSHDYEEEYGFVLTHSDNKLALPDPAL